MYILITVYNFSCEFSNPSLEHIEEETLTRKPAKNNFSNDGSFMENFMRITEAAAKKAQEDKDKQEKEKLEKEEVERKAKEEEEESEEETDSEESEGDDQNAFSHNAGDRQNNRPARYQNHPNQNRQHYRPNFHNPHKHPYQQSQQMPPFQGHPMPLNFGPPGMHMHPGPNFGPPGTMPQFNPSGPPGLPMPHFQQPIIPGTQGPVPFMQPPGHFTLPATGVPPPPPPARPSADPPAFQTSSGKPPLQNFPNTQPQNAQMPSQPVPLTNIPPPRELDLNAIPEPKMNVETIQVPEFPCQETRRLDSPEG